ncbi:PEP-CTERM sorting domain-containing protein [Cerasicoccus frondis]|uniref:PEP-CTERM sorting domain-containing protein n=1 Tax=Cerasicoccus frondis TaxID=490090 RepID=UPI00285261B9|nr:PEP-CTERM sorting domain-containing protein [Cerasicoccus frondis]
MTKISLSVGALLLATSLHAQQVFTPASWGDLTFLQFSVAFDAQPTLSDLATSPSIVPATSPDGFSLGSNGSIGNFSNGFAYIDFGADFASVEIIELWTAYRKFSTLPDPATSFGTLFWSDSQSQTKGAVGTFEDINPADFNFGTATSVDAPNTGSGVTWFQDFEYSTPVTPSHRYLILGTGSNGFEAGRVTELAIITAAIPEPATYTLLFGAAILGLGALRRSKRKSTAN